MSIEATEEFLRASNTTQRPARRSVTIPFAEKSSRRFHTFVQTLQRLSAEPVRIWIPTAESCGLSPAVRLDEIDFGFEFELSLDGILEVHTADHQDRLLLDYFEERGEQRLEIDVAGPNWSKATY